MTRHALLWAIKDNWHLSSLLPLVLALTLGLVLLYVRRTAIWGRRWLTAVILGYWAMATPMGSWLISAPLVHGQPRLETVADARGAQAVVVLGGGIVSRSANGMVLDDLMASGLRVIEVARVYRLLGNPLLVVSGGNTQRLKVPRPESAALRRAAVSLGVPTGRVLEDDKSLTTREQAVEIARLLGERHIDRFVLVTSPLHMRRSMAAFLTVGLNPVPSASQLRGDSDAPFWTLRPDRESLNLSDGALYEYAALVYYWVDGWLPRPGR